MTLHEAPTGAVLERRGAGDEKVTVIVLTHFADLFGAGTTYRHFGSFTILTLDETATTDTDAHAASDWTRTDAQERDPKPKR